MFSCIFITHSLGQSVTELHDEAGADAIRNRGFKIEGWSKNEDPANPGYYVQCRQFESAQEVATLDNGEKFYLVYLGPSSNWLWWAKGQPIPCTNFSNFNLSGNWTYAGTRGQVIITQSSDDVKMHLTVKPRKAPSPHYEVQARLAGNDLIGTWKFTVGNLVGNDKRFAPSNCKGGKFYAKVSPDGKTFTVTSSTEDPCNHDWAGMKFYKK